MRVDVPGRVDVAGRGLGPGEVCRESGRRECAERKRAGNRKREGRPFHPASLSFVALVGHLRHPVRFVGTSGRAAEEPFATGLIVAGSLE
jgi:hypothetical protein